MSIIEKRIQRIESIISPKMPKMISIRIKDSDEQEDILKKYENEPDMHVVFLPEKKPQGEPVGFII